MPKVLFWQSSVWRFAVKHIQLKDFAKARGQPEAASLLGITQGALSKALRVGRDVFVIEHADGRFTAFETRSFPSRISSNPRVAPTMSQKIRASLLLEESGEPAVYLSSAGQ
ncbi:MULTISPECIES: Cro/CI family transcriptional regulator [unclassified Pseudomonas]|jgi:hypothetical protein|uniref:Cro/CI family transcriptional regulator n=1 Tax=unclassified Pseudomonas TaxID=196821 RepID=UPI003158A301